MLKPKPYYPASTMLLLLFLLLFSSCQKGDFSPFQSRDAEEKFLPISEISNPTLLKVAHFIEAQNNISPFVAKVAEREGIPLWKDAITRKGTAVSIDGEEGVEFYIPLSKENSEKIFTVYVGVVEGENVRLKIIRSNGYRKYGFNSESQSNADAAIGLCMFFENRIYGTTSFVWPDGRVFNDNPLPKDSTKLRFLTFEAKKVNSPTTSYATPDGMVYVDMCYSVWGPKCGDALNPNCHEYVERTHCETLASWYQESPGGGSGGENEAVDWLDDSTGPLPEGGGSGSLPHISDYYHGLPVHTDGVVSSYFYNNPQFWESEQEFHELFFNNVLNVHGFTTQNLANLGTARGWNVGVTQIEFNRKVGKAFEETALAYYGLTENRTNYEAPGRAAQNAPGGPTKVRPDNLDNFMVHWESSNGASHISQLYNIFATEVKAVNGPITLSGNNWQILGELELIRKNFDDQVNLPYWQQLQPPLHIHSLKNGPVIFFITTENTTIDQSVITKAASLGITIWQSKAIFNASTNKIGFGPIKYVYDKSGRYYNGNNVPRQMFTAVLNGAFNQESPMHLLTPVQPNFDLDPETIE